MVLNWNNANSFLEHANSHLIVYVSLFSATVNLRRDRITVLPTTNQMRKTTTKTTKRVKKSVMKTKRVQRGREVTTRHTTRNRRSILTNKCNVKLRSFHIAGLFGDAIPIYLLIVNET